MKPVRMFTTLSCPYCIRAKALLQQRGVAAIDEVRVDGGRLSVVVAGTVLEVSRRHTRELRDRLVRAARPGRGGSGA